MARNPRLPQAGPSFFDEPDLPEPEVAVQPVVSRKLIVEADGGSRGNPGLAAYGALVLDAGTGELLDEEGLVIGHATNNVAEYSGLIAALEMARAIDPSASVEVRMDSKLVVEQMAGRWKIKHPDMKPLALKAQGLRPRSVVWTWIPREQNKAADRLANEAMDGRPCRRQHQL
ncbi:MAG: reverse transcriptase-like protein [Micropruina sp.]|nr:reverse transcriptase-like protein [Micropruina sp.]